MIIKQILVPLDGSELSERALPYAGELARALDARLILLGVVPPPPGRGGGAFRAATDFMAGIFLPDEQNDLDKSLHPISKDSQMASLEAEVKRVLLPIAERLQAEGIQAEVAVAYGRPAGGIIQYAQHEHVDLIVMSTHGDGDGANPYTYAFGGTADRVARRAPAPVLLVRPEEISQALLQSFMEGKQK